MSRSPDPDWLAAPETVSLRRELAELQKKALDRLISVASVSSDPSVRKEHAEYRAYTGCLAAVSPPKDVLR